jgi:hypothetical protein
MKVSAGITVLLIATVSALAGDEPKVVSVSGAFSPYVRSERWGQVTAKLDNPTEQAMQVKFIFFAEDPASGQIHYTRRVNLPPRTRRTVRLGHRVGPIKPKRSSSKKLLHNNIQQKFRLENAATNKILDSNLILVRPLGPKQYCLAYVDPEALPGQDHSYLAKIPDSPFGQVSLASSSQRLLPDRWYGYSLLETLLISSSEPAELLDSQIDAVLDWVGRGGVLLVTAHSAAERTLSGRLAEAAGVVVAGTHQEYRLEARSTEGKERFDIDLATPMIMAQLCPMSGTEVLWETNGMPFLTARRFGSGTIFMLSVPIGALTTDRSRALWQTINRQAKRTTPISVDAFAEAAKDKLSQIAGRRSPDRRAPVYIVGVLAVLFGLMGLFLRFIRRGELTWLVMIPIGLLGTAGMLVWGMTLRDEPRLSFLAMASSRPDGTAHIQQLSTYYSPETEDVAFSSGSPLGTIRPSASASISVMQSTEISAERTMALEDVRVIANSSRTAYAESPIIMPVRLVTKLSLGPKGLTGTITNNTGADVFDAVVIASGRAYSVGDLPAGRTTEVVINDPPLPKDTYTEKTVRSDKDLLRNDLISAMISPASGQNRRLSNPSPMLLGWSRQRLLDPLDKTLTEKIESNGLTLLTSPLAMLKSLSGTKVVVPGGLLKLHIGGRPPVWVPKDRRFNESNLSGAVVLNFAPPAAAAELTDARATLQITMRAPNCRIRFFAVTGAEDKAEGQTLIRTIDRPVGTYKISVENLRRIEGAYKITIKVDPVTTDKQNKRERISTLWKIESLNLTLEGVSK